MRSAPETPSRSASVRHPDCNNDGVPDSQEIGAGASDLNDDGVPDACQCLADLHANGVVDGRDLGVLLSYWGRSSSTPARIIHDGAVDGADLGILLAAWGMCPN